MLTHAAVEIETKDHCKQIHSCDGFMEVGMYLENIFKFEKIISFNFQTDQHSIFSYKYKYGSALSS